MSTNGLPGLRRLDHIGITVPDLHEATKFFIDALLAKQGALNPPTGRLPLQLSAG